MTYIIYAQRQNEKEQGLSWLQGPVSAQWLNSRPQRLSLQARRGLRGLELGLEACGCAGGKWLQEGQFEAFSY